VLFRSLAGCAVLRVDVDVYKGPLANHEEVQMEQLAVMAVGAEALVKSLERKQKDPELASLLREVRFLFEDTDKIQDLSFAAHPEVLRSQTMLESGLKLLGQYTNAFERLERTDEALVTKLERGLKGEARNGKELNGLWRAYKAYLAPQNGFRKAKDVIEAHVGWWNSLTATNEIKKDWRYDPVHLFTNTSQENMSSNFAFEKLADPGLLQIHAKALFQNEEARKELENAVREAARSFAEARNALANLFELCLRGLEVAERIPFADQRRDLLVFNLAKFAAHLIQPTHLRAALDSPGASAEARQFKERLNAALRPQFATDFDRWNHSNRAVIEGALIQVLREKPAASADALLELHKSFKKELRLASWSHAPDEKRNKLADSIRRKYGLARGPTEEGEELISTVSIEPYLKAVALLDSSLATRGRTKTGLYRLIEDYLNAVHKRADDKVIEERRERLVKVLIHFAEKLLFIANHDSLVANRSDSIEARRHVLVLQAVGFSLPATSPLPAKRFSVVVEPLAPPSLSDIVQAGSEIGRAHV